MNKASNVSEVSAGNCRLCRAEKHGQNPSQPNAPPSHISCMAFKYIHETMYCYTLGSFFIACSNHIYFEFSISASQSVVFVVVVVVEWDDTNIFIKDHFSFHARKLDTDLNSRKRFHTFCGNNFTKLKCKTFFPTTLISTMYRRVSSG